MSRSRVTRWPLSLRFSTGEILVAQLLGVLGGAAARSSGLSSWGSLAVTLTITLIAIMRVGTLSVFDWARTLFRFVRTPIHEPVRTISFDALTDQSIGLRWDGGNVVAVVEVVAPVGNLTRMTRNGVESTHELPLGVLAEHLKQHDISLSGIDIVSHGCRTVAASPASEVYEQLLGPLPASANRIVWLALRLNATANIAALARRGGGAEGASRALGIAANRVVRVLADSGCQARILTAPEVESAVRHLGLGADPETVTERWRYVPLPGACNTGYGIDPRELTKDLLAQLWVPSSLGTTVTIRLRPSNLHGQVRIGASYRLTTRTIPKRSGLPGLISMHGRHRDGLLASLPVAVPGLEGLTPWKDVLAEEVRALHLSPGGCGQLIGSDDEGRAITTSVTGSGVRTVFIAGEPYLGRQLVFRAIATGARILIRTTRPDAWSSLIDSVSTPDRLRMAGVDPQSDNTFDTVLFDGVSAPSPHSAKTALHLHATPDQWPGEEPDLSIVQPHAYGERITLSTGGRSIEVILVTIPSETAFIGHPRAVNEYPLLIRN